MMIAGNPAHFSVVFEKIKEWNIDNSFNNGILLFFIDGCFFTQHSDDIVVATLSVEIPTLSEKLRNPAVDLLIYNLDKNEAFARMYQRTFPDSISEDNDYRFNISPYCFSDHNCFIFAVSNGIYVRILAAAQLIYDRNEFIHNFEDANVMEAFVPINEINRIAVTLSNWQKDQLQ